MKIGFCMLLWTTSVDDSHRSLIEKLKQTGYDGVEIPVFAGNPDDYARIGTMLDDLEMVTGAYWGAYGASKAALAGMVRQFDASLSHSNVHVRGIIPGAMRTGFRANVYHAENPLDQPEPAIVAGKISGMLGGEYAENELIVDLSAG